LCAELLRIGQIKMAEVQILMAVYNGEEYLRAQFDSLRSQTFEDWNLLVSDDGSTDGSLGIINEYCSLDSRIMLVLDDAHFGGAKNHFMALLRLADAPYVMTCDQDDVWDADKVDVTLAAMKEAERLGERPLLVCTDLRVVDHDLNVLSPSFLEYSGMDASKRDMGYFLASCLVTGCTMMVNKKLLHLLQRPVDEDAIIMHDWWASLVAAAFGEVIHLNRATISYRQHGDNSVGAQRFSVARALAAIKEKTATESAAIDQASELRRVFAGELSEEQVAQISAIERTRAVAPIARIGLLSQAGVWRHGLMRNAGTLFAFLSI
jgi:glycosyltransferase involved in cell wall biosynthesis